MQDFASKRDALFASLDDASKELKGTQLDQSAMATNTINILKRSTNASLDSVYRNSLGDGVRHDHVDSNSPDKSLSRMRGKESIFKKPELPISKCLKPRKTPDYQLNPHKWKKYSLSDVDISDQTNNTAAFAFLRAIDEQRDAQAEFEDDLTASKDFKIEFKKSSKIKRHLKALNNDEVADVEVDKPKLKGSKFMMPEYVVGQRLDKKKKHIGSGGKQQNKTRGKQLTLTHLLDPEEDEEDNDDMLG